MTDERTYLQVKEIQDIFGLSKDTAYRLLRTPGCPCIRIGNRYVVRREKFFEWIDSYEGKQIVLD